MSIKQLHITPTGKQFAIHVDVILNELKIAHQEINQAESSSIPLLGCRLLSAITTFPIDPAINARRPFKPLGNLRAWF